MNSSRPVTGRGDTVGRDGDSVSHSVSDSDSGSADQSAGGAGLFGSRPEAFIWKGRLYVVRQVLAHWQERRAWWRDVPAEPGGESGPESGAGPEAALRSAARERQVWRVEASPGWSFASGVYDLACSPDASAPESGREQWALVRVAD